MTFKTPGVCVCVLHTVAKRYVLWHLDELLNFLRERLALTLYERYDFSWRKMESLYLLLTAAAEERPWSYLAIGAI